MTCRAHPPAGEDYACPSNLIWATHVYDVDEAAGTLILVAWKSYLHAFVPFWQNPWQMDPPCWLPGSSTRFVTGGTDDDPSIRVWDVDTSTGTFILVLEQNAAHQKRLSMAEYTSLGRRVDFSYCLTNIPTSD